MDNSKLRFYPGTSTAGAVLPLARYLPPLLPGMAAAWLADNVPPGSWLLDPLGASPALALEAARAGYRVLVASNNPIISFQLETLARAPKKTEFQAALAELATTRRGEERLEVHLKSLYETQCDTCGETVQAQAFLWRRSETQPFARLYNCPKCGESGERPVTPEDLKRLAGMGGDRLQRARALQRVIMDDQEHRPDVEEALENYLPRPLYVLFTLANKLEGSGMPPERARLLQALLISTFDAGSTLWPWPGGRSRPRQLTVPPQFRENNLWLALEEAVNEWSNQAEPVRVTHWPELPPAPDPGTTTNAGAICLFRGRVKALMPLPEGATPQAVITVFPRPSQAFWTLSVLWAGWLWRPEAALPLRNVLDRRRYDWNWHTSAIHNALAAVGWTLSADTPFFGLLPELAPGFLSAAVVAAGSAGFRLDGLALRAEQELAQGLWKPIPLTPAAREKAERALERDLPAPTAAEMEAAAREAIRADLQARNEPAPYILEYAAGLTALARAGAVPRSRAAASGGYNSVPGDLLTRVQAVLARTFADRSFLRVYGGPAEEERGAWFLARPPVPGSAESDLPLADRVEMEVVRFLQKRRSAGEEKANTTFEELDQALCGQFTGLLTPPAELVRACLESYGDSVRSQPGTWRMPDSETGAARKNDLLEMRSLLETIAGRLGYTMQETTPGSLSSTLIWVNNGGLPAGGEPEWWFYRMASSIISRYVLAAPPEPARSSTPPGRRILVIPGSRARLLSYKLHRDPRLEEALQGWRFLKFRHLRAIAGRLQSEPIRPGAETWEALLSEDPLTDEVTQMQLFTL